jgi:hypothetical protein
MHEAREVFISIKCFDFFIRNAMLKHPVPNTTRTRTHGWRDGEKYVGGEDKRGCISINDVKGMYITHISYILCT